MGNKCIAIVRFLWSQYRYTSTCTQVPYGARKSARCERNWRMRTKTGLILVIRLFDLPQLPAFYSYLSVHFVKTERNHLLKSTALLYVRTLWWNNSSSNDSTYQLRRCDKNRHLTKFLFSLFSKSNRKCLILLAKTAAKVKLTDEASFLVLDSR